MKRTWELHPIPICKCGAVEKMAKMMEDDKIHQFLMGLDDDVYSTIRSQILALDPLHSLDKIFNRYNKKRITKR